MQGCVKTPCLSLKSPVLCFLCILEVCPCPYMLPIHPPRRIWTARTELDRKREAPAEISEHQKARKAAIQCVLNTLADLIADAAQLGVEPASPIAFSIAEACQATGLSRSTLHRAVKEKQLRTANIGRRRLVTHEELKRFLKAMER
jgi:excisionase family DNA binding protein